MSEQSLPLKWIAASELSKKQMLEARLFRQDLDSSFSASFLDDDTECKQTLPCFVSHSSRQPADLLFHTQSYCVSKVPNHSLIYLQDSFFFFESFNTGCNYSGVLQSGQLHPVLDTLVCRPNAGRTRFSSKSNSSIFSRGLNSFNLNEWSQTSSLVVAEGIIRLQGLSVLLLPYQGTYPWMHLTDQILKILVLKHLLSDDLFSSIKFIVSSEARNRERLRDFYEAGATNLFSIPPNHIVLTEQQLCLPDVNINQALPSERYREILVDSFRSLSNSRIDTNRYSAKIYVPRLPPSNGRLIENETEIAEYLRSRGFQTIDLTLLSQMEQFMLYSQARFIVFTSGSSASNLIFSKATVLELAPSTMQIGEVMNISSPSNNHHILYSDYDNLTVSFSSSFVESMFFSVERVAIAIDYLLEVDSKYDEHFETVFLSGKLRNDSD
jgi:hypothetical protein